MEYKNHSIERALNEFTHYRFGDGCRTPLSPQELYALFGHLRGKDPRKIGSFLTDCIQESYNRTHHDHFVVGGVENFGNDLTGDKSNPLHVTCLGGLEGTCFRGARDLNVWVDGQVPEGVGYTTRCTFTIRETFQRSNGAYQKALNRRLRAAGIATPY